MKVISLTNNFILLTPPKTAATSLVVSLSDHIEMYNVENTEVGFDYTEHPPEPQPGRENRLAKHYDARWYYNQIVSCKYKVFGCTRNPWDRMVSWWLWNNKAKNHDQTFESFLKDPFNTGWWWLYTNTIDFASLNNKTNTAFHDHNPVGPPASEYVDMYLRFENLQEDFDIMCDKVGIEKRKLPHKNKSERRDYTEYYNDETQQFVADIFAKDIEYFGYDYK